MHFYTNSNVARHSFRGIEKIFQEEFLQKKAWRMLEKSTDIEKQIRK